MSCANQIYLCDQVGNEPAVSQSDWPAVHNRVAQLKGFGNAIVPEVAAGIMYGILKSEARR